MRLQSLPRLNFVKNQEYRREVHGGFRVVRTSDDASSTAPRKHSGGVECSKRMNPLADFLPDPFLPIGNFADCRLPAEFGKSVDVL